MTKRRTHLSLILAVLFLTSTALADPNNSGGVLSTGSVVTTSPTTGSVAGP